MAFWLLRGLETYNCTFFLSFSLEDEYNIFRINGAEKTKINSKIDLPACLPARLPFPVGSAGLSALPVVVEIN